MNFVIAKSGGCDWTEWFWNHLQLWFQTKIALHSVQFPLQMYNAFSMLMEWYGQMLETSALETLYSGQFTLSTQKIKRNSVVIPPFLPPTDTEPVSLETYPLNGIIFGYCYVRFFF